MNDYTTSQFLDNLADQLDKMVRESITGGWSTWFNERMTGLANDCRREAERLRKLTQQS